MTPGLKGWLLLAGLVPWAEAGVNPVEKGAVEPCGFQNLATGSVPLADLAHAWFLASTCTGEPTLELVVVWRGDEPDWKGTNVSFPVDMDADLDEVMAESLARGHERMEDSLEWGENVVGSLCPGFGVTQTSALRGYLWGAVSCAGTNRWHLVHATDRDQYVIIGHADVSMTGGEVPVLYVDVHRGGARVAGREVREARTADDLVPTADLIQAIREGRAQLDQRGAMTAFLSGSELARGFLEGASVGR